MFRHTKMQIKRNHGEGDSLPYIFCFVQIIGRSSNLVERGLWIALNLTAYVPGQKMR